MEVLPLSGARGRVDLRGVRPAALARRVWRLRASSGKQTVVTGSNLSVSDRRATAANRPVENLTNGR